MALVLLLLTACDATDCEPPTVWSPVFGQCIGAEEVEPPATTETTTEDTGATTSR